MTRTFSPQEDLVVQVFPKLEELYRQVVSLTEHLNGLTKDILAMRQELGRALLELPPEQASELELV